MRAISLAFSLFFSAAAVSAQEPVVKSKIVAAGLFKNGLAVIKREVILPGPGTFRLDNLPEPVHGTWWIESQSAVDTKVKSKEVDVPVGADIHFQEDLAGKQVTVHFKDGKSTPVSGIVLKINGIREESVAEDDGVDSARAAAVSGRFLVLKTPRGRVYIDVPNISIVEAEGADDLVRKERRPVLLLSAPKGQKDEKVLISYLTPGLGWAASYRVDISDPKTLAIELSALVKNELSKFEDTELRLISGFPSVQFAHVRSPLSPMQSWASFFQQLQSGPGRQHEFMTQLSLGNSIASNAQVFQNDNFGLGAGATPQGEGVDLHFQPIGKRTLAKGEALSLSIAAEKAPYERVIEWLIPDNRDEHGRYRKGDLENEEAWDALRFKNPFPFPMTTGPAMVTAQGQFNGQRTSYYVSTGEETMLRITKALRGCSKSHQAARLAA
jgi:hypothetical protein